MTKRTNTKKPRLLDYVLGCLLKDSLSTKEVRYQEHAGFNTKNPGFVEFVAENLEREDSATNTHYAYIDLDNVRYLRIAFGAKKTTIGHSANDGNDNGKLIITFFDPSPKRMKTFR